MTSATQCLLFIPCLFPKPGILTAKQRPSSKANLKFKIYIIRYLYRILHHLSLVLTRSHAHTLHAHTLHAPRSHAHTRKKNSLKYKNFSFIQLFPNIFWLGKNDFELHANQAKRLVACALYGNCFSQG